MVKRLSNFFKTTLHPEMYHGTVMVPSFFEGWYFKVVDSTGLQSFAFIGKCSKNSGATHFWLDDVGTFVINSMYLFNP